MSFLAQGNLIVRVTTTARTEDLAGGSGCWVTLSRSGRTPEQIHGCAPVGTLRAELGYGL